MRGLDCEWMNGLKDEMCSLKGGAFPNAIHIPKLLECIYLMYETEHIKENWLLDTGEICGGRHERELSWIK